MKIISTDYMPKGKKRRDFEKMVDDVVLEQKGIDSDFSDGCDVLNEKAWDRKTTFYAVVYEAYLKQEVNNKATTWNSERNAKVL